MPTPLPTPVSAAAAPPSFKVLPVAGPARRRPRHWGLLAVFIVVVIVPVIVAAVYLYSFAADQYVSRLGFSVRTEQTTSAFEILGGISELSGGGSSDTDILNEYIRSQEMVERIDALLDLRAIYSRPGNDPWFALAPGGTIEDLVAYWDRMVRISYDGASELIELRVHAFDPADAQAIAQAVFTESSRMINDLSAIAREDATRYAREELDRAVERLKVARETLTRFRSTSQIVDPTADIQGQMGLLNTLEAQLAEALIEMDLVTETSREGDPRVTQLERRVAVIRARITDERRKFGAGATSEDGVDYATIVADFERLTVDREFAEQTYLAALAAFDSAQAEARRQSRYLAAYVKPTLAQRAEYPQRPLLIGLVALFALMGWGLLALIYYSLRDRR